MDSETINVYDTLEEAKKGLQDVLKSFGISKRDCYDYSDMVCYWDLEDFWGGLAIEEHTLIRT